MRNITIELAHISTKKSFLKLMSKECHFPSYFGFNYDALDDCMRDLLWFDEDEITVIFRNLERVKNKSKVLYVDIKESIELYIEYWNTYDSKKVLVYEVN